MADQHVKGAVSTATSVVKESAGRVTGNTRVETEGRVLQVKGKTQGVLGDVEDAVRKVGRA
jgi:uncharacterized protein YjbJ (UPF0337 family)